MRHRRFFSLAELNAAIAELLPALNERPFQGRTESRKDLFEALDRPALKPLPQDDYRTPSGARRSPASTTTSRWTSASTAFPMPWWGRSWSCASTTVEVMHKGKRVAVHPRHGRERFSTLPSTCPSPTRPTGTGHRGAS